MGFLPEAFINMLALLGGTMAVDKKYFQKKNLIGSFPMDRVHSAGAKFDFEKAKWFNHEWIKTHDDESCCNALKKEAAGKRSDYFRRQNNRSHRWLRRDALS